MIKNNYNEKPVVSVSYCSCGSLMLNGKCTSCRPLEKSSSLILFWTGFLQVFLVTVQTYFIAKSFFPAVGIVAFLVSFLWTFNVRKTAFGGWFDRFLYSFGASFGATIGLLASKLVM